MIKTLISIHLDLASSLAIRFVCQMANHIDLEIHPVHVKGGDLHGPHIGAGWARRTWEREVLSRAREEIMEMISSEMGFCPVIQQPRVIFGDKDAELLKHIAAESFDLYVEGVFYQWTSSEIHKRVRSRLFQKALCPVMMVKGLKPIKRLALLCPTPDETILLADMAKGLWCRSRLPITLIKHPKGKTNGDLLDEAMRTSKKTLESSGCEVSQLEISETQ